MRWTQDDLRAAEKCPLLTGDVREALTFFRAEAETLSKGAMPVHMGDPFDRFGLVVSGTVQVCSDDAYGRHLLYANVPSGGVFGEALCYLKVQDSPVYVVTVTAVRVLWLHTDALNAPGGDRFKARFTALVSRKLLQMNDRVQALSRPTLREKLLEVLSQEARKAADTEFVLPMNREDLAAYLGVNRSALSRTLSGMKRDGLIDYHRSRFTLLTNKNGG